MVVLWLEPFLLQELFDDALYDPWLAEDLPMETAE